MASGSSEDSDFFQPPKRQKRQNKSRVKPDYIFSSSSDLRCTDDRKGDKSYKPISKKEMEMVSQWNEQVLNDIGISYDGEFTDVHKLLDCVPTICRREELSKQSMETINSLDNILSFNIEINQHGVIGRPKFDIKILNEILKEIEACRCSPSLVHAGSLIRHIIFAMQYQFDIYLIRKNAYTDMVRELGAICGLFPEGGSTIRRVLRLKSTNATSIPDIRFKVRQVDIEHKTLSVASITEVKDSFLKSKYRQSESSIHNLFESGILGQHGGQLIAEWPFSFARPYVVGMMVCRNNIIFTLLNLNFKEYTDITEFGRIKTEEQENAVKILYSEPLDFFFKKDRKILFEVLFRLSEVGFSKT